MDVLEERKQRLHTLIDIARVTRGWSRAQIASVLERDPTKIYPDTGNPKMDFLVRLAEALEWSVGSVVEVVWGDQVPEGHEASPPLDAPTFSELNTRLVEAHRAGRNTLVVDLARQMLEVASTNEQKAHALAREAFAWDAMGRYAKTIETLNTALALRGVSTRLRRIMQANMAAAQYALWDLTPALGTADYLAKWYQQNPPESVLDEKRPAFVNYLRGHIHRRLIAIEPEVASQHADAAHDGLRLAAEQHERLADILGDHTLLGIANSCRGGLLEVDVEQGRASADETVASMLAKIEAASRDASLSGYTLEGWGWWCIFACNIALRHLGGSHLQQAVNQLTSHAIDFADRLGHWAMRERAFTLQLALHERIKASTGIEVPISLSHEQRPLIASTMGRFPRFRTVGWQILEMNNLVREPSRSR